MRRNLYIRGDDNKTCDFATPKIELDLVEIFIYSAMHLFIRHMAVSPIELELKELLTSKELRLLEAVTKSVSLDDEVSRVFKGEVSSTTLMEGLSEVAAAARPEGLTISSSTLPGSTELTAALVTDR